MSIAVGRGEAPHGPRVRLPNRDRNLEKSGDLWSVCDVRAIQAACGKLSLLDSLSAFGALQSYIMQISGFER